MSGSRGCNSYTTTYELDGSSLSIAPEIAATRRACPDPDRLDLFRPGQTFAVTFERD